MAIELPQPNAPISSVGGADVSTSSPAPPASFTTPRAGRHWLADPEAQLVVWLALLISAGCVLAALIMLAGADMKLVLALLAYLWLMSMAIMAAS